MSPKVEGFAVLQELCKNDPLDFFINCSSLGNVLYKFKYGQVAYNCANEYLDAIPYDHGFSDTCLVSTINWDDWGEAGMTVNALSKRIESGTMDAGDAAQVI